MSIFDSPYLVFAFALVVQGLAAYAGDLFRKKGRPLRKEERQDFDILRTASLTLLGLIIGFSFAMAVSRYDERKKFEVAEANAIGTEYLRANLMPAGMRHMCEHCSDSILASGSSSIWPQTSVAWVRSMLKPKNYRLTFGQQSYVLRQHSRHPW